LAHQIGAFTAEHHGEHEGTGARGVVDGDAVQFAEGLRVEGRRLQEPGGLQARQRESDAGADRGDDRRRSDGRPTRRHGGEVAALEDRGQFGGGGIRVPPPEAAQMCEHDGALDAEETVEGRIDGARRVSATGRSAGRGHEGLGSLGHPYRV